MSAPSNRQEVPAPHRDWTGQNEVDAPASRSIAKRARLWRPLKTILEPLACTLARYAHRVIDRQTGIPYSADELETKITNDLNVPVTTVGGHGAADTGKAALFGTSGTFVATDTIFIARSSDLEADACVLNAETLTAARDWALPDASGVIPSVPAYADLATANAALTAGDFWWDTTLNKLRTATA